MLIEFNIENSFSFKKPQSFSLLASKSTNENFNNENTIEIDEFGIGSTLKSAAIFGANASGKSNFFQSLKTFQGIVLKSIKNVDSNYLEAVIPFLMDKETINSPTEFEVSFIHNKTLYRYGLSILKGKVEEEWLFKTTKREAALFHREGQKIDYNKSSFKEAKDFVKQTKDGLQVSKTRDNVPFISVISQFDGEVSSQIIDWFKKLHIISGSREKGFRNFTIEKFEQDLEFKKWSLQILSGLQIQDIEIEEVDDLVPDAVNEIRENKNLHAAYSAIQDFINSSEKKSKELRVLKKLSDNGVVSFPIKLESEGTQKLIYLLGPLYDSMKSGDVLFIDEFDNKFHTLLCKYIISVFNEGNVYNSQLILACHDTNLLTKEIFRRDQIWFVDKDNTHESTLYSLLEYKEHYARVGDSYSRDYLSGKYGAIPLFSSIEEISRACSGKE